jgi:hypothetical protein
LAVTTETDLGVSTPLTAAGGDGVGELTVEVDAPLHPISGQAAINANTA